MKHTTKAEDPVAAIRQRAKQLRGRKGWTGADLGQHMTAKGVPWDRSIVANLENGRRRTVSVVELLALARVFDVAPVHLMVPLGDRDYQATPSERCSTSAARAWIRGEAPLPDTDTHVFRTEVPEDEFFDSARPVDAQMEEKAVQHFVPGIDAALKAGLTEDQVVDWVRSAYRLSRTLRGAGAESDG